MSSNLLSIATGITPVSESMLPVFGETQTLGARTSLFFCVEYTTKNGHRWRLVQQYTHILSLLCVELHENIPR